MPSLGIGASGAPLLTSGRTSATGGPSGASPPPEGLAAPLLTHLGDLKRHSIDERWPDEEIGEGVPHQQQRIKAVPMQLQQTLQKESDGGTLRALVFGGINTLVGLPALIAFATIVFQVLRKVLFRPHKP